MDTQPLVKTRRALRRGLRFAGLLGAGLLCALTIGPVDATALTDSSAQVAAQSTTPTAESWFRPAPTCSLPVGCPPVSLPSPYPEGTLHVGVAAGQEESRSYISLPLPVSGVQGGSLLLPVGASTDGSAQPEAAKVRACLVTGTVKDKVAGEMTKAAAADCTVFSPAVAKTSGTSIVLTVDLAPFVRDWSGASEGSLALVPDPTVAPTDVWHVAFSRHDRKGEGVTPLSATLLVNAAAPSAGEEPVEAPPLPTPDMPFATLPPVIPGSVPGVVPDVVAPQQPNVAGAPDLVPAARQVFDTSFAYPGVFLLPPVVLLAAAWLARAFTRDLGAEQR